MSSDGKAVTKRPSHALSGDRVHAAIVQMDREPFRALLEEMIGARPTVKNMTEWAQTNPDRWAQSLGIIARLTGYDFKGTVEHTHRHLHLHTLSDSELEEELRQMRDGTASPPPRDEVAAGDDAEDVLEGEIVEMAEALGLGDDEDEDEGLINRGEDDAAPGSAWS